MKPINSTDLKKIRIYGAGGHSQVIREVMEENGYKITDTFDDKPSGSHYASKNVTSGARDNLSKFPHKGSPVIIAVGINAERAEIAKFLKSSFEIAIHHSAIIAKSAKIGEGTVVFAGAIIQPNTTIGSHVIINTAASIDHDNVIGDYAHISPKATLCGHVEVGEGSHVGVGAVVIPKVKIGKWCTIGAGAVILNNVPDYSTVVGNPGKVIKTNIPNIVAKVKKTVSDVTFIGSGIATSFSIINLLKELKKTDSEAPLQITIIDKFNEFNTGIPYGKRSGSSVHLITSLKNFLPQPHLDKFKIWLNNNKNWLLDDLVTDGGKLSKEWVTDHKFDIDINKWDNLFIPRRFFGYYINECVKDLIEKARINGYALVTYINNEVSDITKTGCDFEIKLQNNTLKTNKVILSVGSLPVNFLWKKETLIQEENLLFINNPYQPTLNSILNKVENFTANKPNRSINVLIIGANASGLEMIYKLNDLEAIESRLNNVTILSTQGILPDSIIDHEISKKFKAENLKALVDKESLTAKEIAEAAFKDLDIADKINLGAASTVSIISKAFGKLLDKLNPKELESFACRYGNEIGRRQRCAGYHYAKRIETLKSQNRFDHIAGRFSDLQKNENGAYQLEYLDTKTKTTKIHSEKFDVVVNCIGSTNFSNTDIPELLQKIITKGYVTPNSSQIGLKVNDSLEASKNFYVMGPLLAGNTLEGKAVWHAEHCGRLIWLSKIISKKLFEIHLEKVHDNSTLVLSK